VKSTVIKELHATTRHARASTPSVRSSRPRGRAFSSAGDWTCHRMARHYGRRGAQRISRRRGLDSRRRNERLAFSSHPILPFIRSDAPLRIESNLAGRFPGPADDLRQLLVGRCVLRSGTQTRACVFREMLNARSELVPQVHPRIVAHRRTKIAERNRRDAASNMGSRPHPSLTDVRVRRQIRSV